MKYLKNSLVTVSLLIFCLGAILVTKGKSQTQNITPYLHIKNIIVDGDTLPTTKYNLKLPWHAKKVRIEFEVLPEESPNYIIRYACQGKLRFEGRTRNRYFELPDLNPKEAYQISLLLLSPEGIQMSNLTIQVQTQQRPSPELRLKELFIDSESQGSKSQFELAPGKHQIQFVFEIKPNYPDCELRYDFLGPDFQIQNQIVTENALTFEVNNPGEYNLAVQLLESKSQLHLRFRVRDILFKEHPRLIMLLGLLGYFLVSIGLAYLIVKDANKINREVRYWVIFTLFTNILGFLVYKIYSSSAMRNCPECNELISPQYKFCPFCQTQLKDSCPQCGITVQTWMHYCNGCGAEIRPKREEVS